MQAYISRTFAHLNAPWHGTGSSGIVMGMFNSQLPPLCAYCGDEVYNEAEPIPNTNSEWTEWTLTWPSYNFFHVNDNTPICDAKI